MRILHLMLANFYIDNYNYQENILPKIDKSEGHDVKIITSTETFDSNMKNFYTTPRRYLNEDGIEVVRLPYKKGLSFFLDTKIRNYIGLSEEIDVYKPDIIFCHGIQFKGLDIVGKYKQKNPSVKVFADNHADYFNSARTFISKQILYKQFYNKIIKRNLFYIEKLFCVSKEAMDFMNDVCEVDYDKLEFFPLGGIIKDEKDYAFSRKKYRETLGASSCDMVIMHSGKLEPRKKTKELIEAFTSVKNENAMLVIIGSLPETEAQDMLKLIRSDLRIKFLGWKTGKELLSYLDACDIYAQPGTQSATMQNAACARAAMLLFPYKSHKYIFGDKALYVENKEDITKCLNDIFEKRIDIEKIKNDCFEIAKEKLDYQKMSKRYTEYK